MENIIEINNLTFKYDIGTKGAWYTEERAKKFIIPNEELSNR